MTKITPIARPRNNISNRTKKTSRAQNSGVVARNDLDKQDAVDQCLIDPIALTLQEVPRDNSSGVQPEKLKGSSDALDSHKKDLLLNK